MAFAAQGATFTFSTAQGNVTAKVTRLSVETPIAEIVDMTAGGDALKTVGLVPTGDWKGGSISVDFIYADPGTDPQTIVGIVGNLTFASPKLTVNRRAILESADYQAPTGDLVRGTLNFRMTDWAGT